MKTTTELLGAEFVIGDDISREIPLCEQPQSRFETHGREALSDTELVALVLRSGKTTTCETLDTAAKIIAAAGSVAALATWTPNDFCVFGVSEAKATTFATLAEFARRMTAGLGDSVLLNRAQLIADYMAPECVGLEVEKFWVLCLNRKNRLLKRVCITTGTATAALAHAREVFRPAIRESAAGIICVHNHPSGDPSPSAPDLQVTRMLRDAAKAVDIVLLDHVICGRAAADPLGRGFYSFREAGLL